MCVGSEVREFGKGFPTNVAWAAGVSGHPAWQEEVKVSAGNTVLDPTLNFSHYDLLLAHPVKSKRILHLSPAKRLSRR